ncbi:hypothetical protein MTO96_049549 [Rhipicephalus appendiculatus]
MDWSNIQEVQTYVVIHHPPVKTAAQGRTAVAPGTAAAGRGGGHHAAASSISTSYGYQLHRETNHHVPVLITTGHLPVLARAPAHKTYVTVQHLHHAVHHVHQPLVLLPPQHHLPVHHRRRDRLTAQSSSFRQKHNPYADAEYPPLNMRNRRKLYSLGYIYMLDFLENSYLKR